MMIPFLALMIAFTQQGTVVVHTGMAEAEFYLDGNFVAKTDASGSLVMEGFPAGSFKFMVRKTDYLPYQGQFNLAEGATKTLNIKLEPIKPPPSPPEPAKARNPKRRTQDAPEPEPNAEPANPEPAPPRPEPIPAKQMTPETPSMPAKADPGSSFSWFFVITVVALGAGGFWLWQRQSTRMQAEMAYQEEPDFEASPGLRNERPAPEFIEALRRKEELIKAGLVSNNPPVPTEQKEIVIVLPKESYHYEDEK